MTAADSKRTCMHGWRFHAAHAMAGPCNSCSLPGVILCEVERPSRGLACNKLPGAVLHRCQRRAVQVHGGGGLLSCGSSRVLHSITRGSAGLGVSTGDDFSTGTTSPWP